MSRVSEYQIRLNHDKVIAKVSADSEIQALYNFADFNMNHVSNLNGDLQIKDEGHCLSYTYDDNIFSVDKFFIWGK